MVSIITYLSVSKNILCVCDRLVHNEVSISGPSDISKASSGVGSSAIVSFVHLEPTMRCVWSL